MIIGSLQGYKTKLRKPILVRARFHSEASPPASRRCAQVDERLKDLCLSF
jgi:hypothetical protein